MIHSSQNWRSTLSSQPSLQHAIYGYLRNVSAIFVLCVVATNVSAQEGVTYLKCTANNSSFDGSHGGGKERHFKVTSAPKKFTFGEVPSAAVLASGSIPMKMPIATC